MNVLNIKVFIRRVILPAELKMKPLWLGNPACHIQEIYLKLSSNDDKKQIVLLSMEFM